MKSTYKVVLAIFICACMTTVFACISPTVHMDNSMIVRNMFKEFAEGLDVSKLDKYYSHDFILESNTVTYDYQTYKNLETNIYKTLKSLHVQYEDIFSTANKVTARMKITLTHKDGKVNDFYVILIARLHEGKIDRIWEITYPSWSDKLPAAQVK
jgi:ketosteroid isomerase-like protein